MHTVEVEALGSHTYKGTLYEAGATYERDHSTAVEAERNRVVRILTDSKEKAAAGPSKNKAAGPSKSKAVADMSRDELLAEVESRGVAVEGSGKDGYVTVADMRKALGAE